MTLQPSPSHDSRPPTHRTFRLRYKEPTIQYTHLGIRVTYPTNPTPTHSHIPPSQHPHPICLAAASQQPHKAEKAEHIVLSKASRQTPRPSICLTCRPLPCPTGAHPPRLIKENAHGDTTPLHRASQPHVHAILHPYTVTYTHASPPAQPPFPHPLTCHDTILDSSART